MKWFLSYPMAILLLFVAVSSGCGGRDTINKPRNNPNPDKRRAESLPSITDIESIKTDYYEPAAEETVAFVVKEPHWSKIFAALLPARQDEYPEKWKGLGKLKIKKKMGDQLTVWLFSVSDGPGAFATGKSWEDRGYFRGGHSTKLKQALQAAYEASRQAP